MISAQKRTVVVVEDDRDTSEMLELAIAMEGYTARSAADPLEALDLISATKPELVLLDYYGVTAELESFVNSIRAIHPTTRIVLMTGAKKPADKASQLGLKEWLAKPFDSNTLQQLLRAKRPAGRKSARKAQSVPAEQPFAFNLF